MLKFRIGVLFFLFMRVFETEGIIKQLVEDKLKIL